MKNCILPFYLLLLLFPTTLFADIVWQGKKVDS